MVTGARGQLGADLQAQLDGADVLAVSHAELDITDSAAVDAAVVEFRPDVVINAAAYTAVDAAEEDEQQAYAVNATAPGLLAAALARRGGRLVQVSTDYVFAGDAETPYDVDDPTGPRSAYGRTKLAGEQAVRALLPDASWVVRTAWVYGAHGSNFVKTMARLEGERETVSVVDDQRGSPTWSADLAAALIELGRHSPAVPAGIYHCTNQGETTWFGLSQAVFAELGADVGRVLPTTSQEFLRPAPRPAYSVLSARAWQSAGLAPLPHWRDALGRAFAGAGKQLRGG
ncbi:MAG: dTDP-4-dehydrorhamnose reductase [Jatrophihabitans sp.]